MKRKTLISLGLAILTFVLVLIPCVYGWATNFYVRDIIVDAGVIGGYFAGGNGTEDKPYEIANKRHLYNLAWLQYMGNFNHKSSENEEEYETYYFKLSNDLDCDGMVLPPIGTSDNPFVSVFDGGGYTISNLKVSNNYNQLEQHPNNVNVTNYQGVNIIGFFGIVGKYTGTENNSLSIPVVADGQGGTSVITDVHDFYLDNLEINSNKANSLVGLLAGYVSGNVSNIGIHYSWFNMASSVTNIDQKKVSNYALIGDYNINGEGGIEWVDKPEGGAVGYGASTDLKELCELYGNNGIKKGMAFPFRPESSNVITPANDTKTMILSGGAKSVTVATTQEASQENIGYYVGSDIKFYNKPFTYDKFYYPNNSSESSLLPFESWDGKKYNAPDQSIIDYLNSAKGQYQMRNTGSEIDTNNEQGYVVVENGRIGDYYGDILVPQRCIWVAPRTAGTLKFVLPNVENSSMGVRINKLTRSVPKDYSTYIYNTTSILEFNGVLLGKLAYYFEIEVTQEDVDAGYEYAITGGNGYKTYASYIDIGANGGNVNPTYIGTIEGVDFVYTVGNGYNSFDDKSEVLFGIDNVSSDVLVYFKRNDQMVLYFVTSEGVDVTPIGSGSSKKATDKNCNS